MLLTSSLHYGGAERQVVELAKHLDRRRFDPFLCCLDGTRTLFDLNPSPTRLVIAKRRTRFDPIPLVKVAWLMHRLSIDVVHTFLFDAEIIGRLMGGLTRGLAVIGSERNSDYPPRPIKDRIQRWTIPLVDVIVANSHAGKRYLVEQLGVSESKVAVVQNGIDTQRFQPGDKSRARQILGIPDKARVVGMFSSFRAHKNHEMYFRAARRILDKRPDTRFLSISYVDWQPWNGMVGDAYQAKLHALLRQLGLADRLLILTNRPDVDALYQACDLTVLTSEREGTPNVVLESMASGVPVLATDVADNALILDETSGGGVVPRGDDRVLADRVCSLLNDPAALSCAGRKARRAAVERFSLAQFASAIEAVYEATWARKARRATSDLINIESSDVSSQGR